jgi:metallo-beta-lactamase family protein
LTPATLMFLGATGTVTGSRFLVEVGEHRVLLDCGLFQGLKELRLRNWAPFPVDPREIDAVVLTHAHLDHVGYLPALVRDGFTGPVLTTAGSAALAKVVLTDSAHLQEEQAAHADRHGYSKHRPPRPLYTTADAGAALLRFRAIDLDIPTPVCGGVDVVLHHAGHILGAAQVELRVDGGPTLWLTGDLGRADHPLLRPPTPLGDCDVLLVESTYGERLHEPHEDGVARLAEVISGADERGGVTVIPAFAVDRTELLLMELRRLKEDGRIPDLPIFVDSPMALEGLRLYREALRTDPSIRPDAAAAGDPFDPGRLSELRSPEGSRSINRRSRGILISASGMAEGGRVLHHLRQRLPDPRNAVVLVGHQAPGTRGQALQEGARQVKIHGEYVPVAAEVVTVSSFSVHADRDELVTWLGAAPRRPGVTYVVHGEPSAAMALRDEVSGKLGWHVVVPRHGERVVLGPRTDH